jgi:Argininosuccinate lyase
MGRLWETNKDISKKILNFTVGKDNKLDERLIKYDIIGTIAHVKMLKEIGILNEDEKEKIIKALNELLSKKQIKISKSEEDSHTKIENYLVRKLGDIGKKVHTARSRNDQVVTALRLYYKDSLKRIKLQARKLIKTLKTLRKEYGDVEIPGFTHYRKATPTTVDVWLGSFIESLEDDLKVFKSIEYLIDQNPLGSGAGYGVPNIKVDRTITQKELKFKRIQENPLYVQNSRGKFESAIAFALSMILFDITNSQAT